MSFLWSLGAFLVAISVLVAVHEYGHFWAARKCGVKVHRFSIGFGKVLWSKTDKQGTEFALAAIPLGGYVKMLDGRNEEVPAELKNQAFDQKSVGQRAFVIFAGPLFNFLFAIVAYFAVYSIGIPSVKPVIAEVEPNSIAAQANIQPNSLILAVNDAPAESWEDINMQLAAKVGDQTATLTITPFGENQPQQKTLDLSHWQFDPENQTAFGALGIVPVRTKVEMVITKISEKSPALLAGLQVGDKLLQADGSELQWQQFVTEVQQGKPLDLLVERANERKAVRLVPELNDKNKWFVGIAPKVEPVQDIYRTELKYDILGALQKGIQKTGEVSWLTLKVLGKLLTGDLSLNNLSGPISIAKGAGATSEIGLVYYLSFLALISINLGIMNLFPIPVLDGGHLVFLAVEAVRGKPVSERTQNFTFRIGAALLLTLMAFALFNDFLRL